MHAESIASRPVQVVGLVLALGAGLLPLGTWGRATRLLGPLASDEIFWWVAVAVVILYVLFIERRPLTSVGFRAVRGHRGSGGRNCRNPAGVSGSPRATASGRQYNQDPGKPVSLPPRIGLIVPSSNMVMTAPEIVVFGCTSGHSSNQAAMGATQRSIGTRA